MNIPNELELLDNLGKVAYALDKAYMPRLETDYGIMAFDEHYNNAADYLEKGEIEPRISYAANVRAVRVKNLVFNSEENELDCLRNVLAAFSNSENTIALVINRSPEGTEMFFVVKNEIAGGNEYSKDSLELLEKALRGNLAGSEFERISTEKEIKKILKLDKAKAISMLSAVPSEKSEKYISQRIDKLLNGVVPTEEKESYSIVIAARSLLQSDIRGILSAYEEIATAIKPFEEHQFQIGKNQTETTGEMEQLSDTTGLTRTKIKMKNINLGISGGLSNEDSVTNGENVNNGPVAALAVKSTATAIGTAVGSVVPGVGTVAGAALGSIVGSVAGKVVGTIVGRTTHINSETHGAGSNLGGSIGFGYTWGRSIAETSQKTETTGTNHSLSLGTSENNTYTYRSYMVSDMLKKVEETIERIVKSQSDGLWDCAAYVLTEDVPTGKNIANFLRSMIQGDESYIEPSVVQSWLYEDSNGITAFSEIKKYVSFFTHPVFVNIKDGVPVTAASRISTKELAMMFSLPKHSVSGIPVIEHASFGRNIIKTDGSKAHGELELGSIYHMGRSESLNVKLDHDNLTAHTFVTGSTGSGKSNTIFYMLSNIRNMKNTHFMVIEPAKGEYKNVFGGYKNVKVYGTNPRYTDMLRIDPFKFPDKIHVLEHLDRLVEIFSVCWPMYAAMPSILKKSIEKAYEAAGWNLESSTNAFHRYPTFDDVKKQIYQVVNQSAYSAENKSNYIGSLATRVDSLTTGLYRMIFTDKSLDDSELFDKNVIVDISRIGSSETKALIMGIMIMKLHEYRLDAPSNSLKHITVLEEAHNILRRTSTEQVTEGANLMGKSVEMLANAIAEMRASGEGFIIADQSPGLLDLSVIRNTNTKIVLRLPDQSDRELVGKAMGMNDAQVAELARLATGVAAVYQNDWHEAVLCKIEKMTSRKGLPRRKPVKSNTKVISKFIKEILTGGPMKNGDKNTGSDLVRYTAEENAEIKDWIHNLRGMNATKDILLRALNGERLTAKEKSTVAYNLFRGNVIYNILIKESKEDEGIDLTKKYISSLYQELDCETAERIRQLIMSEMYNLRPNELNRYRVY